MTNVEIVIDIETVGKSKDDFSEYEYEKIEKTLGEEPEQYFALYPQTGFIVCIACKNIISGKGFVIHINDINYKESDKNNPFTYYGVPNEREVLSLFWNMIDLMQKDGHNLSRLISFNGKRFDVPFILLRSAANSVNITHSLGYKGGPEFHLDLWEEFSFGRKIRAFSIDIIANMLGLNCHRNNDYNGKLVWEWYNNKEYKKIAELCISDVLLTENIYKTLKNSWGKIIFL
ncbi:MAG TPA: ribonuclease H-like domain-containing protein [Spirochaetota bacterium]|nr:ribonuclease H-like domain-containing protein [Spirochaetota bacterium]HOM38644.1 ribonuclease H-like domain-containing protein [Spirochaetota bacterium]HPQ49840.1 ribonuclease H-like domain-containing protein [Spirochaetota bacterium]